LKKKRKTRVLAVASFGGHWVQLKRLKKAWDDCDVFYITTSSAVDSEGEIVYVVTDASRTSKFRLLLQLVQVWFYVVKVNPDVLVSTGASAGVFAMWIAKITGARTIWIDSIANTEQLSLSAQKAARSSDLLLTQWPHLVEQYQLRFEKLRDCGKVF
jgi:hypothetical protein